MRKNNVNRYKRDAHAYYNANGGGQGQRMQELDPNDRTMTVSVDPIVNTVIGKARIFGATQGLDETFNASNNVTVAIGESSHNAVKIGSIGNPFRIKGIIYTVSSGSVLQLAKVFTLKYKSLEGLSVDKTWQPQNHTDPQNFNNLMIKTTQYQMVVDAYSFMEVDLIVGASFTMVLTVNDKIDVSQVLSDRPIMSTANRYGRR